MVTMVRWLAPVALAVALGACGKEEGAATQTGSGATPAPIAAPAGTDWTQTVSVSPAGGFVMGNPDAPVKLVEYASMTCPHCAEFSEKGGAALRDTYVKSGQVSWEFRNFVLNAVDMPVSLLARCQGAEPFFQLSEQLYANQAQWSATLQAAAGPAEARLAAMPPQAQMAEIIRLAGLDSFFRQRGMPEARIAQCLGDKSQADALAKLLETGKADGITGTPSFLINGALQADTYDWATLEPKLKGAIAG